MNRVTDSPTKIQMKNHSNGNNWICIWIQFQIVTQCRQFDFIWWLKVIPKEKKNVPMANVSLAAFWKWQKVIWEAMFRENCLGNPGIYIEPLFSSDWTTQCLEREWSSECVMTHSSRLHDRQANVANFEYVRPRTIIFCEKSDDYLSNNYIFSWKKDRETIAFMNVAKYIRFRIYRYSPIQSSIRFFIELIKVKWIQIIVTYEFIDFNEEKYNESEKINIPFIVFRGIEYLDPVIAILNANDNTLDLCDRQFIRNSSSASLFCVCRNITESNFDAKAILLRECMEIQFLVSINWDKMRN